VTAPQVRAAAVAAVALAAGVCAAVSVGATGGAAAGRLEGTFLVAGRITAAVGVPGEVKGTTIARYWGFSSACPVGQCHTVTLERQTAGAPLYVLLKRYAIGRYRGRSAFSAPVMCGSRVRKVGELIPYTVTIRVTQSEPGADGLDATHLDATYVNLTRTNLTRCVNALGHDAAKYHGHLLVSAATTTATTPTTPATTPTTTSVAQTGSIVKK
jgi:hypothetical protein